MIARPDQDLTPLLLLRPWWLSLDALVNFDDLALTDVNGVHRLVVTYRLVHVLLDQVVAFAEEIFEVRAAGCGEKL